MSLELGGNISLEGFNELGAGELVVVKKLVGRYARKMSDVSPGYEGLKVTMKPVHKTKSGEKYELHASCGKLTSEVTDRNLFVALDSVLKKVFDQIK